MAVSVSSTPAGGAPAKLRLALVDSHQLFRECLATALRSTGRYEVEAMAQPGPRLWEGARFETVLLALEGLAEDPADLVRDLNSRRADLTVVVLGAADDEILLVACLEAGAAGCVFPEQSLAEVATALERLAAGEAFFPPRLAGSLFARLAQVGRERRRRERLGSLKLTAREFEILGLVAEGMSNEAIASRLYLSIHTIKNHVHKILETLGVENRWEAARFAIDRGWLPERRTSRKETERDLNLY